VYLGVEQHGPYTSKIRKMTRLLDLVKSPWIRVNYDCGNTFLSGEDPYEMLDAVIDRVVHVHAKDISVSQAEKERGKVTGTAVGCACGDGVIDWCRLHGGTLGRVRDRGRSRQVVRLHDEGDGRTPGLRTDDPGPARGDAAGPVQAIEGMR
jgi:hypothetical protein